MTHTQQMVQTNPSQAVVDEPALVVRQHPRANKCPAANTRILGRAALVILMHSPGRP